MLGVLHRAALRLPPQQFWQWAKPDHRDLRRSVRQQRNTSRPLLPIDEALVRRIGRHSLFGLIGVYNLLPNYIVQHETVKEFQKSLSKLLREHAKTGRDNWSDMFSCRCPLSSHPLRHFP